MRPEFSNMFEKAARQVFQTCLKIAGFSERPGDGLMKFQEPLWRIKIGVKFWKNTKSQSKTFQWK